jgi:hypothetical protein
MQRLRAFVRAAKALAVDTSEGFLNSRSGETAAGWAASAHRLYGVYSGSAANYPRRREGRGGGGVNIVIR